MYMYIDNYDDNTKYTKYMIVLDYYTHKHRETGHKIKKKGYKGHTQTKKKKKKKTRSRKRWLHSKVTCSEVYVHGQWRHAEVKDRPGQTRHQ